MKIKRIKIKKYKNLENIDLIFEESFNFKVLIGKNGSGKSNVLEALILIFDKLLDNCNSKNFLSNFEIEYECDGNKVKAYQVDEKLYGEIVDKLSYDNWEVIKETAKSKYMKILPENILIYYNGTNTRVKEFIKGYEKKFSDNLKNGISKFEKRVFFYFQNEHFNVILFSLFIHEIEEVKQKILKELGIKKLIQCVFERNVHAEIKKGSITEQYLNVLKDISKVENEKFIINIEQLEGIYKKFDILSNARDILKIIDVLIQSNIIKKIELKIIKNDDIISDQDISEGEKQLIITKMLAEHFSYKETLYLFDEVDVYLHLDWQRKLIEMLKEIEVKNDIVLTTHSPITISEIKDKCIYIVENGNVIKSYIDTYGLDPEYIQKILLNVSSKKEEFEVLITKFHDLILEKNTEEAIKILEELREKGLSEDDIFFSIGDASIRRLRRRNEIHSKK